MLKEQKQSKKICSPRIILIPKEDLMGLETLSNLDRIDITDGLGNKTDIEIVTNVSEDYSRFVTARHEHNPGQLPSIVQRAYKSLGEIEGGFVYKEMSKVPHFKGEDSYIKLSSLNQVREE